MLTRVSKPSRYLGNEYNVVRKEWSTTQVRVALAFPDLYEIGMSHQGLQILYHILNEKSDYLAERVYAPDRDLEDLLRAEGTSLFSLESKRPLNEFDILGITLPYELCYTNILTILDLSHIPFRAVDRDERFPLIIGGGPCAFHPEPVAEFFDAILLGDGEEAVLSLAACVSQAKKESLSRKEVLDRLSMIPGVYIPSLFEPRYADNGDLLEICSLKKGYEKVTRAVLADLDSAKTLSAPLVPLAKIVHDRLGLEIARGCTRGCRFCQAGMIYRPVREVSPQKIMAIAKSGIEKGGFEEMALLSLSTGDYSCLPGLLTALMNTYAEQNVAISMPSMRVGTLTKEIMEQIKRVRKTGFTIAPEAGSERLRRVINKGITEEDLLETCTSAFDLGWKIIKLYFMCGLPMETEEDLDAIPELLTKALSLTRGRNGRKINASMGVFVPKPHTPFQWEAQLSIDEGFERIFYLKKRMPKGAALKWNDPKLSFLEGVFSRGDRKLSRVIEEAWRCGARLDGWSEYFSLPLWEQAASTCGIELSHYLRRRDVNEVLPWEHLSAGVDDDFLKDELEKAKQEVYTPDCRVHGCQKCGLCDFKLVQPVSHAKEGLDNLAFSPDESSQAEGQFTDKRDVQQDHFFYRIAYERTGSSRFLGHLELLQAIFRAIRRVGLPVNFSQGYHPSPKVSFGPALPVGTISLAEYFVVDLSQPLSEVDAWMKRLNIEMPEDILIKGISITGKKMPAKVVTDYTIQLPGKVNSQVIDDFLNASDYFISVTRKRKVRKINIRPSVRHLEAGTDGIHLALETEIGKSACKPVELIQSLLNLSAQEVLQAKIVKTAFQVCE